MSRYIDADEIYYHKNCGGCNGSNCEQCDDYVARKSDIDCISTADVQEVKHGRWEHTNDGAARCTSCKRKMNPYVYGYAYCPLCGARMDGNKE